MLIFKLLSYLTKFIVVDRVKWFRDRAACDRSEEEKEILEEEFAHSERSKSTHSSACKKFGLF